MYGRISTGRKAPLKITKIQEPNARRKEVDSPTPNSTIIEEITASAKLETNNTVKLRITPLIILEGCIGILSTHS
jgi:hypothetical protein